MARKNQNPSTSRSKPSTRSRTVSTANNQPSTPRQKTDSTSRESKTALEPLAAPNTPSRNEQSVFLKSDVELQQNGSEPNKAQLPEQWIALQGEIDRLQEEYKKLQQICSEQSKVIDKLEGEVTEHHVTQSGYQKRYVALQEECIVKAQTIEQLREEVAALKVQVKQQVAEQTSEQLTVLKAQVEQQLTEHVTQLSVNAAKEQSVSDLQQQIAVLRGEVDRQVMTQMQQQQRYEVLHRQSQEQAHLIAELRELVMQEQRYSAIGEAHLNKWRYRTFSS